MPAPLCCHEFWLSSREAELLDVARLGGVRGRSADGASVTPLLGRVEEPSVGLLGEDGAHSHSKTAGKIIFNTKGLASWAAYRVLR